MKYQINEERTQYDAQRYRIQCMMSVTIGCIGVVGTFAGLMGAIIMQYIDTLASPTPCITVMAIGLCLFGLGKLIAPIKTMALVFQELTNDGHILEISCIPIENTEIMVAKALVETPSGKCEMVTLGQVRTCVHTQYTEQTLDVNDECIYFPYQPTTT